jgi:hypothetical protein
MFMARPFDSRDWSGAFWHEFRPVPNAIWLKSGQNALKFTDVITSWKCVITRWKFVITWWR